MLLLKRNFTIALGITLLAVLIGWGIYIKVSDVSLSLVTAPPDNVTDAGVSAEQRHESIRLSHIGHFYNAAINLEMTSEDGGTIYYTKDGSEPSPDKRASRKYKSSIMIEAGSSRAVATVIKAKVFYDDGSSSDTLTHTYITSKAISSRFDTLVFSVSTEPDYLFDYETGIFVAGKLRDDYIKENPDAVIEPPAPANYNLRGKENERPIYLEVFENDGTEVISQNAGIRTFGGWSRDSTQKPFKLFARREYDSVNNDFDYNFFPEMLRDTDNTVIDEYKRLVLRNSGNDHAFGFIRDEFTGTLAGMSGFRDTQSCRPAAVFINGTYYGMYWLHEPYDKQYFENHYGEHDGEFQVLSGSEVEKDEDEDFPGAELEYNEMYAKFTEADLTDDKVYAELCKAVDVENYITYCAIQMYANNGDWPRGNYKAYRYKSPDGTYEDSGVFDGKWRYLLYDTDWTFGLYDNDPSTEPFSKFLNNSSDESFNLPLLKKLLERDDCRDLFISFSSDIMNTTFGFTNVEAVLDRLDAERDNELRHALSDSRGIIADWTSYEYVKGNIHSMKEWAVLRPQYYMLYMQDYFGLNGFYSFSTETCRHAEVTLNTQTLYQPMTDGIFPSGYDVTLSCKPDYGYKFDCWELDGKVYSTSDTITITEEMCADGALTAVPRVSVSDSINGTGLTVKEISMRGSNDYIILCNYSNEPAKTLGYYLSDSSEELDRFYIPSTVIEPMGELKILCKNYDDVSALMQISANFNLKDGETLFLSKHDGEKLNVVEEILIPKVKKGNVYSRSLEDMRFYEIAGSSGDTK